MSVNASVNSITSNATAIFSDTPFNDPGLLPMAYTSMAIAIIVVSLRIYCRWFLVRKVWWDDGFSVLALLACTSETVISLYSRKYGWGHHAVDIPPLPEYVVGALKTLFMSEVTMAIATGLTKISILLFYVRITAGGAHSTLRYLSIFSLVAIGIWVIAMTIVVCVQCIPTSHFWDILDYEERAAACAPWAGKFPLFLGQGVTNTLGDVLVIILPLNHFCHLRLPRVQKGILILVFLLGLLATVAGAIRIYFIAVSYESPDNTWDGSLGFALITLEGNIGVTCASIPALKPLVTQVTQLLRRRNACPGSKTSWTSENFTHAEFDSRRLELMLEPI